jgi:hypothetical protein
MKRFVLPKAGGRSVYALRGTNSDIRRVLEMCIAEAVRQTKNIAPSFRRATQKETCQAIYSYIMAHVAYVEDGEEFQDIRLPARLLSSGRGDCKSMALFIAGCLKNLGIPCYFNYVSFKQGVLTPGHVYVSTRNCIIDPVTRRFDYEAPYKHRFVKKV